MISKTVKCSAKLHISQKRHEAPVGKAYTQWWLHRCPEAFVATSEIGVPVDLFSYDAAYLWEVLPAVF